MMTEPRIIISGGGTGGHIFPAVSIANAVKAKCPDAKILFIGAEGRMEMTRVPEAGYEIKGLPVRGLIRPLWSPKNIGVMIDFFLSRHKVKRIIKSFKPQVAVGVGGYASAPTLNAAAAMGIPCLIQEQNSYAGVTNRSLAKKAAKICVAYDEMERFFPADRIIKTGNPVRQALLANTMTKAEAREAMGLQKDLPTILVIGGSLGARTINNSIAAGIQRFEQAGIQVVWQTGKFYAEECERKAKEANAKIVRPQAFISDMATAYKAADIVISRAGASSISELCLLGKASILVPSPNVAEDHQTKNARALSDKGAAVFVPDNQAERTLVEEAVALVSNATAIEKLEQEVKKLALPDSADIIADEVLKLVKNS
ncbi:MAG: undecaprenyldiphospho-muramoylpentapeptide beta-N-acetylglucosaminyltransferase [Prevotella sp.]|nr:undecaprenyldiphospho-muramoylpentapeptide beta-N-acetylglucosaminyltransferase [Prevotella sp.]MBO6234657.1 undecaprenyldiphospho-muramoylpentapeptide beta-N-acetylglucosaminyltransferase [Prevotella sp.]MBP3750237.1 undecaprenyldiphospho-muramoylpentapeptide beta-N-acetylglucosaminyltransferase [Prevotella sp.]MBQ2534516.1 undecaprenyldiphospho-muramoylpentapeptide beta-N-acetylglucosaminyltransferase [Prevotella sp.]MBQ4041785.1 undecaprenyldiphospho-muramoylpentapeptide beta-N-acetylgluc